MKIEQVNKAVIAIDKYIYMHIDGFGHDGVSGEYTQFYPEQTWRDEWFVFIEELKVYLGNNKVHDQFYFNDYWAEEPEVGWDKLREALWALCAIEIPEDVVFVEVVSK